LTVLSESVTNNQEDINCWPVLTQHFLLIENCQKRVRFDLTEQSLECQLRFAAKYGSLHKINQLVTVQHADINAPNYNSHTPLVVGILNNQIESVRLLCELGADVNYTAEKIHGYCPLHFAAEQDNGEMIELLIEHGAKLNAQTLTGCTALHLAAMNGNMQATRWLCLNGASVNISEFYNGYTPLHYAMVRGHKNVVQLLQEFNATLNDQYFQSHTLLTMCHKALWKYLHDMKKEPEFLEQLCLHVIRKNFLQQNAHKNASQLPLPRCMIEKILLEEYSS
jgi:ankyrin repeat protein